jgi:hypothetical protein
MFIRYGMRLPGCHRPFFKDDPAGDDGGVGAGTSPKGSEGDDAAHGVTEDRVNQIVDNAIAKRLGAFEKKQSKTLEDFGKSLASTLGDTLGASLDEKLSALKPSADKDKPKTEPIDLSQHPEFKAIKRQNEDLQKRLDAADTEKRAARASTRDVKLRERLQKELIDRGVDAKRARKAVNELVDGEKLVFYESDDDDAQVVFRDADGGNIALSAGIKSWVATEDGKFFLPPSGASGSGDTTGSRKTGGGAGQGSQANGAPPSKAAIGQALLSLSKT